jgi:hypothetical protein
VELRRDGPLERVRDLPALDREPLRPRDGVLLRGFELGHERAQALVPALDRSEVARQLVRFAISASSVPPYLRFRRDSSARRSSIASRRFGSGRSVRQ